MIFSMAGAMECAQGGAFSTEGLPVGDVVPVRMRVALVDLSVRRVFEEVRDTLDVIVMPVRQQRFVDANLLVCQYFLQRLDPFRFALAGVDEQPLRALSDDVGVGSCQT